MASLERAQEGLADAERAAAVHQSAGSKQVNHIMGMLSVRDVLVSVTSQLLEPVIAWQKEEALRDLEDRVGYSE